MLEQLMTRRKLILLASVSSFLSGCSMYMQKTYWEIYRDFANNMKLEWTEPPVVIPKEE